MSRRAALAVLLLAGCVSVPRPAPTPRANELLLALPPAALGRTLHLAQRIAVTRGESHWSFEAQLEAEPDEVRVAAFAMGQTVARMSWNGAHLEETHSTHVPDVVTPARILSDLQLAWWPLEAVRAGLPAGFEVVSEGPVRTVTRAGVPFARVRYLGEGPVWPRLELEQLASGYTLNIESKEAP